MAGQSKQQRGTMERVMHEFKEGELRIAGGKGPKVTNPKQAIAIGLHESGATNQETPAKNKQNLKRTKAKEAKGQTAEAETEGKRAQDRSVAKGAARGNGGSGKAASGSEPTKAELYAKAKQRDIPGRSKMDKGELQRALSH